MRMSPEEKKELDEWVQKQYPISMRRLKLSNPFYEKGKLSILLGISLYALHVFFKIDPLLTASIIFLLVGIVMEIVALVKYYSSLSNEN
tara:strand:+ start:156 stop:422 length:267 start_codon:yes stop_codon:yes gene_type:complete